MRCIRLPYLPEHRIANKCFQSRPSLYPQVNFACEVKRQNVLQCFLPSFSQKQKEFFNAFLISMQKKCLSDFQAQMFDIQHRFDMASPFSSLSVIFVSEQGAHIQIHASRKQLFWRSLTDESGSSIIYDQRQRKLEYRSVYCFSSVLGSALRQSKLK